MSANSACQAVAVFNVEEAKLFEFCEQSEPSRRVVPVAL
jgi:hypothetical protein